VSTKSSVKLSLTRKPNLNLLQINKLPLNNQIISPSKTQNINFFSKNKIETNNKLNSKFSSNQNLSSVSTNQSNYRSSEEFEEDFSPIAKPNKISNILLNTIQLFSNEITEAEGKLSKGTTELGEIFDFTQLNKVLEALPVQTSTFQLPTQISEELTNVGLLSNKRTSNYESLLNSCKTNTMEIFTLLSTHNKQQEDSTPILPNSLFLHNEDFLDSSEESEGDESLENSFSNCTLDVINHSLLEEKKSKIRFPKSKISAVNLAENQANIIKSPTNTIYTNSKSEINLTVNQPEKFSKGVKKDKCLIF